MLKLKQAVAFVLSWNLGGRPKAIHTSFDAYDLILRSRVCQNHKLQIVF